MNTSENHTPLNIEKTFNSYSTVKAQTLKSEGIQLETHTIVLIVTGLLFVGSLGVWAYFNLL